MFFKSNTSKTFLVVAPESSENVLQFCSKMFFCNVCKCSQNIPRYIPKTFLKRIEILLENILIKNVFEMLIQKDISVRVRNTFQKRSQCRKTKVYHRPGTIEGLKY